MYGKFFASTFEGSMYGAGSGVFALWAYVISHTVNSRVEINPVAVAPKIGMSVDEVNEALAYLQAPDEQSRSKEMEGRRMVKEGQFSYFIPNHRAYVGIKDSEDLRAYNARKKRESRDRLKRKERGGVPTASERNYEKAVRNGDAGEIREMEAGQ